MNNNNLTVAKTLSRCWPTDLVNRIDRSDEKLEAVQNAFDIWQESGINARTRLANCKENATVINYLPLEILEELASRETKTTKLFGAILEKRLGLQLALGEKKVWVNARDDDGKTLFERLYEKNGSSAQLQMLIEKGADDESIRRVGLRAAPNVPPRDDPLENISLLEEYASGLSRHVPGRSPVTDEEVKKQMRFELLQERMSRVVEQAERACEEQNERVKEAFASFRRRRAIGLFLLGTVILIGTYQLWTHRAKIQAFFRPASS